MLILTTLVIAFAVAIAQAFVLGQLWLPGGTKPPVGPLSNWFDDGCYDWWLGPGSTPINTP